MVAQNNSQVHGGSKRYSIADEVSIKAVKVDDDIKAKVIKVDTNDKKIALSIKAYEENLDLSQIEKEQVDMEVFKEEWT